MEKSKCTNPIGHQLREYISKAGRSSVSCKFCGDSLNKVRGIAPVKKKAAPKKASSKTPAAEEPKESPEVSKSEHEMEPGNK